MQFFRSFGPMYEQGGHRPVHGLSSIAPCFENRASARQRPTVAPSLASDATSAVDGGNSHNSPKIGPP